MRADKSSGAFGGVATYVVLLVGAVGEGFVVLEKSVECESLVDAVENLWKGVMGRAGQVIGMYPALLLGMCMNDVLTGTGDVKEGEKFAVELRSVESAQSNGTL